MLSPEMTLFAVLLGGAMIAAVLFPILAGRSGANTGDGRAAPGGAVQPHPALDRLWSEKGRVLRAIRDLDFDYDTGKLGDDTYVSQRVYLVRVYAAITKKLDELQAETDAQQARLEAALTAFRRTRSRSQPGE